MNNSTSGTIEISFNLKHDYYIPSEILNLPNIYGTEIEREARILRDGFESGTNGMFDQEISRLMETISSSSPLYYWRILIQALQGLYENDPKVFRDNLKILPAECGPAVLRDVLSVLGDLPGSREKKNSFSRDEKRLYNLISEDRRFIKSVTMQLNDSLEAGEDYFFEFALLAVREIREMDETAGQRLALWCLDTAYQEDMDYTGFLDSLKTLYPPALVMRFSALILSGEDSVEGIKCWLLSLIFRLRAGSLEKQEAAEYLLIIAKLLNDNIGEALPGEIQEIGQILLLLHSELTSFYRMTLSPFSEEKASSHFPEVWAVTLSPRTRLTFTKAEKNRQPGEKKQEIRLQPMQLELFGESVPNSDEAQHPAPTPEETDIWDMSVEITGHGLLSPRPLSSPEELKEILRSRPRYVGPEPWLEIIRKKRRRLI